MSSVQMTVAGLSIDHNTKTPVLILREEQGEAVLPIYIGLMEASAIAAELEGIKLSRPMTHDLLKSVLLALGGALLRVEVTDLRDNTFFASLFVQQGSRVVEIDARPSDAIALALRAGATIFVARHVLGLSAGRRPIEGEKPADVEPIPKVVFVKEGETDQVEDEKWREFLENLNPDDFGKYKM